MNNSSNKAPWWTPGIVILARVSSSIAVPIILALFIGKYFDNKYGTEPFILLILIVVAFIISIFSILKNIKNYINDLKEKK